MAGYYERLIFSKGICYAEFFDTVTDELLAYSPYVTDFDIKGSMNTGEISGGPGNALIMCIPDSARLSISARTADTDLRKLSLPVGGNADGSPVRELVRHITADSSGRLKLSEEALVPPGSAAETPFVYVTDSCGADRETVRAGGGIPRAVTPAEDGSAGGSVDFSAAPGVSYSVRYFTAAPEGSRSFSIPALFAPRVVRAHFALNLYARQPAGSGGSGAAAAMSSGIIGRRHYYIPYYMFTGAYGDSGSQTETGTVDLSGMALSYETGDGERLSYGTVTDEFFEG